MTAYAVIGAFFGDEGKGLTTDYLAHKLGGENVVVVRSNGGAQAAHTVQTPDRRRHVFHHFNSGSFVGARTHLSRFMIINPIAFNEEWDKLVKLGVNPVVTIDPSCMVTTPYDMIINQAIESFRSGKRHGSCGLGINETVERHEYSEDFRIKSGDLIFPSRVETKLKNIREEWVDHRWRHLAYSADIEGAYPMAGEFSDLIVRAEVADNYLNEVGLMMSRVTFVDDSAVMHWRNKEGRPAQHIIFEGAQGLLLDENFGQLPYCTRSSTGLRNIMQLCSLTNIRDINVHYVMRAYTTRHGAGPLIGQCSPTDIGVAFDDPTNVHNPWQESIRVAPLHYDNLQGIRKDQDSIKDWVTEFGFNLTYTVVMTCMDQVEQPPVKATFYHVSGESKYLGIIGQTCKLLGDIISIDFLTSWGPTRQTMRREVVEYFETPSAENALKLVKLCEINDIPYLKNKCDVICRFRNEEERQLIRFASPKELTKRVAAL